MTELGQGEKSMTRRVRLGVVGCGDVATRHYLPPLTSIGDRAELVALYDPDAARLASAARTYGGRPCESLEELLAADVDGVVNLTPPRFHAPINLAILQAGKHLLTEKPLASTLQEAGTLIEAARARDLLLVSAPAITISAFMVDLRRLIAGGAIGRVTHARAQFSTFGPAGWLEYTSDPTWFYQEGAGPLVDLGVYMLHMLTELLGPARRLAALSGISVPTRAIQAGPATGKEIAVTVDDNTQMLLDFGRSTFAHVDASYCVHAAPGPMLEVYGSEGVLTVDNIFDDEGTLRLYRASTRAWETAPRLTATDFPTRGKYIFGGVVHLVDCVQRSQAPLLSAEHARHVLEIMLLAPRASREGRTLDLQTTFPYPKAWDLFERDLAGEPVAQRA
jgi:predicted dehydrogenase